MSRFKRVLEGGVVDTGLQLPHRPEYHVDAIVGKRRKAQQIGTGFYEWPLWKAHPSWDQLQHELAKKKE
jgi:hypothetical protein